MIFSDLDSPNKMDSRPFLEFSILDINSDIAAQLKKFAKGSFNLDDILSTASELKYTKGMQRALNEEWQNPSEEFVRLFASRVYQGRLTQSVTDDLCEQPEQPRVVTTEDELQAFYVIKAIVRAVINVERVFMRDTQSYFRVLIDDNNRKPLCRLFFNTSQKYLGIMDAEKNVTRHPINSLDDIYSFAEQLKETAKLDVDPAAT